jgi:hypothetical protein
MREASNGGISSDIIVAGRSVVKGPRGCCKPKAEGSPIGYHCGISLVISRPRLEYRMILEEPEISSVSVLTTFSLEGPSTGRAPNINSIADVFSEGDSKESCGIVSNSFIRGLVRYQYQWLVDRYH